jgi:protein-tyrosine-phosphatase
MIGVIALIALGSAVAGVLVAFLLFNISQRIQRNRQDDSQKKANLNTGGTTKQRVETMADVGIDKSNGWAEDGPETLLKNHDHVVTLGNQKKSSMSDVVEEPEVIDPENGSGVAEKKQFTEPNIVSMSEISSQKNIATVVEPKELSKPNSAQKQTTVNYRNTSISENQTKSHRTNVLKGPEIIDPKIPSATRQNESPQSDIVKELKTNLAIATIPWSGKLLPFQTLCWNAKHGEREPFEPLLTSHFQELIQLYVDVGLANNIVWLATEIGHRSKELDESYIKLCANIAERIKKIMVEVGSR